MPVRFFMTQKKNAGLLKAKQTSMFFDQPSQIDAQIIFDSKLSYAHPPSSRIFFWQERHFLMVSGDLPVISANKED